MSSGLWWGERTKWDFLFCARKIAAGELRFRLGDEHTKIFVARNGKEVVSSVTVWRISDVRAATENIFTIPEYRRKKIGWKVVEKSLSYLKEQGYWNWARWEWMFFHPEFDKKSLEKMRHHQYV